MVNSALKQYKSVDLAASVQTASPHQLISMLMTGALESIAKAKGAVERQDVDGRTAAINKASSIVLELRGSLDFEAGGEIASNLDALYGYMVTALMQANRDNDSAKLEEVSRLMVEVLDGWTQIPPEFRKQAD